MSSRLSVDMFTFTHFCIQNQFIPINDSERITFMKAISCVSQAYNRNQISDTILYSWLTLLINMDMASTLAIYHVSFIYFYISNNQTETFSL